ncbi:MAG: HAD family hydrolase [Oscillospiraceae bacterium]
MYQSVIFDLDGTLLNTLDDLAAAGNHALSVLGFPTHLPEDYNLMVGSGVPNLIFKMLPETKREPAIQELALSLFRNYYEKHMQDYTAPYPGIIEMLDTFKQRGIAMGVVSNKAHQFVQPIVEQYFPGYFKAFTGLKDGYPVKPDPASVLELMEELEIAPATALYCGDSDVDMYTAHNAKLPACGVLWGFRSRDELIQAGADILVSNAAELQALVLNP